MIEQVTKTDGVCGGDACIAGTRIPVWMVDYYYGKAYSTNMMLKMWPHLTTKQIDAAIEYARVNPDEIEASRLANESA